MTEQETDVQVKLSSQVRYRAVVDEGVLVHLQNGRVVVVNEVGLHIVKVLDQAHNQSMTRTEMGLAVAMEFDTTHEQAMADLEVYLNELDKEQVIEHQPPAPHCEEVSG